MYLTHGKVIEKNNDTTAINSNKTKTKTRLKSFKKKLSQKYSGGIWEEEEEAGRQPKRLNRWRDVLTHEFIDNVMS